MVGDYSWIGVGLATLPFVAILSIYLLYLYRRRWISQTNLMLKSIFSILRHNQALIETYRITANKISPNDPAQYGELAKTYHEKLIFIELGNKNLYIRYSQLLEDFRQSTGSLSWQNWLSSFWSQYQILNKGRMLELELTGLGDKFNQLDEIGDKLGKFSWDVAQSAQNLLATIQTSIEKLNTLISRGANSANLDRSKHKLEEWQSTLLKQIPIVYFSPDMESVQNQSEKAETVRVYQLLQISRREIDAYSAEIDTWVSASNQRDKLVHEIGRYLGSIELLINELENRPVQPVIFNISRPQLGKFQQRYDEVNNKNQNSPPAPENFIAEAKELDGELKLVSELSGRLVGLKKSHDEFLAYWHSKKFKGVAEYLRSTYQKIQEIEQFNIANFEKTTSPSELRIDTDRIAVFLSKYQRFSNSTTITEDELPQKLALMSEFDTILISFDNRLTVVYQRCKALIKMQKDSLVLLALMGQRCIDLAGIFEGNTIFSKSAIQDLKKIESQISQAVQDISNLKVDLVEKKVSRIEKIKERFIQLTDQWGDLLLKNLKIQESHLTNQLQELKDIVWVDDPIYDAAEKMLRLPPVEDGVQVLGRTLLETNIEHLLQVNKIWKERTIIYQQFLEVSNPVLEKYVEAAKFRQDTTRLIQKIDQILPENGEAWPPTSQRLGSERSSYRNLESKWDALRKERLRLKQYFEQFDILADQYAQLQASLSSVVERVLQDQTRYRDLERRLEESKKMWQTVSRNYQDRRGVSDGVTLLLANIEKEILQLKAQYQRGEINAQFAYQRFRGICRKTDESVVELDSGQLIDINGTIQNRL